MHQRQWVVALRKKLTPSAIILCLRAWSTASRGQRLLINLRRNMFNLLSRCFEILRGTTTVAVAYHLLLLGGVCEAQQAHQAILTTGIVWFHLF